MSRFLDIAEPLAKMGIPLTPVRPGTKRAFLPDFPTTATTDLEQITVWDIQFADHNAACVARAEESGVFFWEVDSADVLERVKKETGHDVYAEINTFRVRSRPGRGHFYFRHNAESLARLSNLSQSYVKGGDWSLRVHREYVVAPGSIHPDTGEPYTVVNQAPIAEAPSWLIGWLLSQKITNSSKGQPETLRNERGLVPHGSIHGFMLTAAGKMRDAGLNQDEIEPALLRMVHENCEPPIDDVKVRAMAKSICIYPAGEPGRGRLAMSSSIAALEAATPVEITSELLDKEFPAYDGEEPKELPMLVSGFMPEGVSFFGSLAGTGKTWAGLSLAKALTTGMALWGVFEVPEKVAVLYLIPEASDNSFKRRLKKMGIPQDKNLFRFRTISQGMTRPLTDPMTLAMVKELGKGKRKVLMVVDTAVRFLRAESENNAMENSLMHDSEMLRAIGAETGNSVSILFQHHSPKALKEAADMTLENVLRGTGDFGAMADCVYGFRRDENLYSYGEGPEEVEVVCVKPRDFKPPLPFRLALTRRPRKGEGNEPISLIDTAGDLAYVGNAGLKDANAAKLLAMLKDNPAISFNDLTKELKIKRQAVRDLAHSRGWHQVQRNVLNSDGSLKMKDGKPKTEWVWVSSILQMPTPPAPNTPGMAGGQQPAAPVSLEQEIEAF